MPRAAADRSSSSMPGPPTCTVRPSTRARTPTAADASKSWAGRTATPRRDGLGDDRLGERVLGVALGGGREREQLVEAERVPGGDRGVRHRGLALGEGAGLVEEHRTDRAHGLEGEAVGDEHAAARGTLGGDRHDERDREAEGVRAGDDEHGDRADDGVVGAARERPRDRGDDGGDEGEPEQPACGAVGEALRARASTPAPAPRVAGCPRAPCRRRPPPTRTRMAVSVATVPATTRSPGPRRHRDRTRR